MQGCSGLRFNKVGQDIVKYTIFPKLSIFYTFTFSFKNLDKPNLTNQNREYDHEVFLAAVSKKSSLKSVCYSSQRTTYWRENYSNRYLEN